MTTNEKGHYRWYGVTTKTACGKQDQIGNQSGNHPDAIAAEPIGLSEPVPEWSCSTCAHRPAGWQTTQTAPCGNPVEAGLSHLPGRDPLPPLPRFRLPGQAGEIGRRSWATHQGHVGTLGLHR